LRLTTNSLSSIILLLMWVIEINRLCFINPLKSSSILSHAQSYIAELLECIDKLGYVISCINGTSDNYILGNKTTILLDKQSNYVCLRETKAL
jgi:hypothetical protein